MKVIKRFGSTTVSRLLGLGVFVVVLAFAWPVFSSPLYFLLAGVSPQRPSHSFFIGQQPMPLEARMLGIYGGFTVAVAFLMLFRHRFPAHNLPRGLLGVAPLGLLLTGLDGGNAFLSDLGMPHPYPPMNQLRFLTGVAAGMSVSLFLLPSIALLARRRLQEKATWKTLLGWLLLAEAAYAASGLGHPYVLAIIAVSIAIVGVIGMFWVFNGIAMAWVLRHLRPPIHLGSVLPLALALALVELALLAVLRYWLQNRFGVVWV